jgi:hypothetical protein
MPLFAGLAAHRVLDGFPGFDKALEAGLQGLGEGTCEAPKLGKPSRYPYRNFPPFAYNLPQSDGVLLPKGFNVTSTTNERTPSERLG